MANFKMKNLFIFIQLLLLFCFNDYLLLLFEDEDYHHHHQQQQQQQTVKTTIGHSEICKIKVKIRKKK